MRQIKRLIIDNILPDWYLNIRRWRKAHGGAFPRIRRPITFNEKILHRILFERCPIFAQVVDKAAVRSYVGERLGPEILPTVYHLTSDPRTIPFDRLPDKFVVKPTHGSGWVKIVTDKSTLDPVALVATCAEWLKRSYYKETREIAYKHIKPRVIIEEFIEDGSGFTPNDYRLFVFDGVVKLIQADVDRFTHHFQRFYTPEWQKIDARNAWYDVSGDAREPTHLVEMIKSAEILADGWDFIRVDFYDTPHRFYFGELTLAPNAGRASFFPEEFDYYLGSLWKTRTRRGRP